MRERLTVTMDEEKLISFARSYLAEAFPNPDRIDCPPDHALRQLAENPTKADLSITEHLSRCSPCFLQYQELLAGLKFEKQPVRNRRGVLHLAGISIYVGAGVALVTAAAFCFAFWRSYHHDVRLPRIAQQETGRTPTSGTNGTSAYTAFVLDMSGASHVRGPKQPPRPVVKLPLVPLSLSVYLPMGSEAGVYEVSLKSGDKRIWSGIATAELRDQKTVAKFKLDLSSYPPGRYTLTLSSGTGMAFSQALYLRDKGHEK